jgi:hypothetical protein
MGLIMHGMNIKPSENTSTGIFRVEIQNLSVHLKVEYEGSSETLDLSNKLQCIIPQTVTTVAFTAVINKNTGILYELQISLCVIYTKVIARFYSENIAPL